MTTSAVIALLAAAVWIGWAVALVRAMLRLSEDVRVLQARVDAMVALEISYARLWLPEAPVGGSGGGNSL